MQIICLRTRMQQHMQQIHSAGVEAMLLDYFTLVKKPQNSSKLEVGPRHACMLRDLSKNRDSMSSLSRVLLGFPL